MGDFNKIMTAFLAGLIAFAAVLLCALAIFAFAVTVGEYGPPPIIVSAIVAGIVFGGVFRKAWRSLQ